MRQVHGGYQFGNGVRLIRIRSNHRKSASRIFWRIFVSAIGAALILIAVLNLALFFVGKSTAATVTTRRIGGANDGRPADQRYEWSIDYTYRDQNGVVRNGHTTSYGSDNGVKTDKTVYYFTFAPFISSMESEVVPNFGQLVMALIGAFLIAVMNKKQKKRHWRGKSNASNMPDDYDDSIEELFHGEDQ